MKQICSYSHFLFVFASSIFLFAACGSKEENAQDIDARYYLKFKDSGDRKPYLDWDSSNNYLTLEFDEGIPKGTEWYLECDASWIKLRNTHGKVSSKSEHIPISIENNTNHEDREAYIYLDVPNGSPMSTTYTTITIHQYGFESLLDMGNDISFRTNRLLAETTTLTIEQIKVNQVMDIDWGDGNKDILTKNDYYSTSNLSISHQYNSTRTYDVKLRFAPENDRTSFSFILAKGQGIEKIYYYEGGQITVSIDNSKRVAVIYSDKGGYRVTQY